MYVVKKAYHGMQGFIKRHKKASITILILSMLFLVILLDMLLYPVGLVTTAHTIDLGGQCVLKIAHLSDLHLKGYGVFEESVIDRVVSSNPDIIVLTGDYVESMDGLVYLVRFVKELRSRVGDKPVYAVLGNWEYRVGTIDDVKRIFSRYNVTLLRNNYVELSICDRRVAIVGLDDYLYGSPDYSLLENISRDTLAIVLVHEPITVYNIASYSSSNYTIVLSGHCHGGQVRLFGCTIYLPEGCSRELFEGLHKINDTYVIISRGIGSWDSIPRVGVDPEVVVVEIKL